MINNHTNTGVTEFTILFLRLLK